MRIKVAVLVLVVGCSATRAWAQGVQTSRVVGTVFDSSGAVVPDARVTISGDRLIGGQMIAMSDSAGQYRFLLLPNGRFTVTAAAPAFASHTRSGIELPVATTVTVDLVLQPAELVTRVEVEGEVPPLVDVRSASVSAHIDRRFLENLPTQRSVAGLINLAPGVVADVGFGGSQASNALYVDGVDMNEPNLQGPYLRFNQNWLEQVEVAALGAGAEYGETTGVSMNAIFRSGGNRTAALFEMTMTRPGWLDRNTSSLSAALQRSFEPLQLRSWWDTSAQMGGPIVRDRLWYFGGAQFFRNNYQPALYNGPDEIRQSDERVLAKITAAVTSSIQAEGFLQRGRWVSKGDGVNSLTGPEALSQVWQPQLVWNAKVRWVQSPLLVEIRNGGYRSDLRVEPTPPATREGPPPHFDRRTQARSENIGSFVDGDRTQHTTVATMTALVGDHDLRGGVEYERSDSFNRTGTPGGVSYTDDFGNPFRRTWWNGETTEATSHRTTLLVTDDWVLGRVTLSPGVRIDVNRASVPLYGTIFDTNPVSPRVGAAWDVFDSHRLVVRGHYGRYADPTFHRWIAESDKSRSTIRVTEQITPTGEWQEVQRGSGLVGMPIDPDIEHSYVDQTIAGIGWQLNGHVTAEVTYVHRDFGRFMGFISPGAQFVAVEGRDPGPDGVLSTSSAPSADDGMLVTMFVSAGGGVPSLLSNPEGAYRLYDGLQLVARTRYASWQSQASFTWSHTRGNVDNGWHVNSGLDDLGAGGGFRNPNRFINTDGTSILDVSRELKILTHGYLDIWGGFNVSAVYRYTPGHTWARRAFISAPSTGVPLITDLVWVEPRGSHRLPAINNLDFRIEKVFGLGRFGRVGLSADVFNVTNQGVHNSDTGFAIQTLSGPSFGQPMAWVDPRLLRVGLRLIF